MTNEVTEDELLDTEYKAYLQKVYLIGRVLMDVPCQAMIDRMQMADTLGPMLDPTLWMRGHQPMNQQREALKALKAFQAAMEPLLATQKTR